MPKIIIGIDPGTQVTGYGVISVDRSSITTLDFGCIRPPQKAKLSDRYYIIFQALRTLLKKYSPEEMAIEDQFFSINVQSMLKLGIAKGVAIIAAKEEAIAIYSYSPREVKCATVGTGKATKEQVQRSVARRLGLKTIPEPYDAADALAIAICHTISSTQSLHQTNKEI